MKKQPKHKLEDILAAQIAKLLPWWRFFISFCQLPLQHKYFIFCREFCRSNPYARLMRWHKPLPILLLLLPCLWALALQVKNWQQGIWWTVVFTLGAIVTRSAGCAVNDLLDRKLDAQVARTKNRPLASGELTLQQVLQLLLILMFFGLFFLLLLPPRAIIVGFLAVFLMILYPLAKRFTYYPQVLLGITYNLGVIMAWFSAGGHFGYPVMTLYIAAALWTVGYDTIYAFQDLKDDLRVGIKSLAIKFTAHPGEYVWQLYKISVLLIAILGLLCHMNWFFYMILASAAYHLYWQTEYTDFRNPEHCGRIFNANVFYGVLVLVAILVGRW